MTLAPRSELASDTDSSLWPLVCQGNASAFEFLVRRYQSLVCAVAYSACGDLAQSEDIAQETFWTAWRQRASLEQPDRLKAWLCGIARNLARNARRKASRPVEKAQPLDVFTDLSTDEPGPAAEIVSREEEALLWQTLDKIPETYREPLILFYRENQSAAAVAEALVLTEDTVKQRLSRGRAMLRERLAEVVEAGLTRSRPGRKFTVTVMAGLAAHAASSKTAMAAAGSSAGAAAWKAAAGAAGAGGATAGLLGSLGGLLGGWLGTWIPAQAAATHRERNAILRAGRRMLIVSVLLFAALGGVIYVFAGTPSYFIAWAGCLVAFWAYLAFECFRLVREVKRIRLAQDPHDLPNETPLRAGWSAMAARVGDRVYRSKTSFLGLPLIDINFGPPIPPGEGAKPPSSRLVKPRLGSPAAGSRSATTPAASCLRSAQRPVASLRSAAVPSAL